MTKEERQKEYYRILKEEWERTDKTNREAIRAYNEFKRQLRHDMLDGK